MKSLKTGYIIVMVILMICTVQKCLQYMNMQYGLFLQEKHGKMYPNQAVAGIFNENNVKNKSQTQGEEAQNKDNLLPKKLENGLCKIGFFKVDGMNDCREWLKCEEISKMRKNVEPMGGGIGKQVYLVNWTNSISFALVITRWNLLSRERITTRVRHGAKNLINLQPSKHVIKVVGYCENGNETALVTENCAKYKDFRKFMGKRDFRILSSLEVFSLAIQVVEGFVFLHYESGPPKVHCDLHSAKQALEQFLATDEKKIVLNDVDELPIDQPLKNNTAKCQAEPQCKMSNTSFLAPEQRYTVEECRKKHSQIEVNIKSDVWKIPDITSEIFLGGELKYKVRTEMKGILKLLEPIHKNCKRKLPKDRWTSRQVLKQYQEVYNRMI